MTEKHVPSLRYSICTLVSDRDQYAAMRASFEAHGFVGDCEYMIIDNSRGNVMDAYQGLNHLITQARGEFVIMVHQDVMLLQHDRAHLDSLLDQLELLDRNWAIAGNEGVVDRILIAGNVNNSLLKRNSSSMVVNLPAKVTALDEDFMVMKRAANLAFSRDLSGFHMYGADMCLIADLLGWTSYVIDFYLDHRSDGEMGQSFDRCRVAFIEKWTHALRSRPLRTGITDLRLFAGPAYLRPIQSVVGYISHRLWRLKYRKMKKQFKRTGSWQSPTDERKELTSVRILKAMRRGIGVPGGS